MSVSLIIKCPRDYLCHLTISSSSAVRPVEGITKNVWDWKPVINPVISYTLDSQPMEGITYHERSAREVFLDSRPTEGASCQEPLEQLVLSPSLAARPVDEVAVKVLEGKPVIQPVQDSTPDGQHMEGATYLEHPALGVSLESRLKEGMSHTEIIEQSVLGEGSIVRSETAVTSERHHEQTCVKLSSQPTSASGLTDVKTDINTDRSENSAPGNTSKIFEQSVLGEGPIVRPETAVTSERHHEQTCFKLSARPTPASGLTDVKTDINTDRSENSAPGNTSEIFEQSVLREGSIVRPETAVTSECHHKQTCFNLSARPTPAIVIVHKTDVNTDMNTDWSDNSAPRNTSERFEQSVLGEGSIVRPETMVTSERHHEQTCCNLSAQPTPAIVIVRKTDVNTDIGTDWSENSAPMNLSEIFEQAVLGERSSGYVRATSRTDMF